MSVAMMMHALAPGVRRNVMVVDEVRVRGWCACTVGNGMDVTSYWHIVQSA